MFLLDTLNARIKVFSYGEIEIGYQPPLIKLCHLQNNHLNMSAREMWSFSYHFPLFVGDLVPEDNLVWIFAIKMIQMIDLQLQSQFNIQKIIHLRSLISSLNQMYTDIFKDSLKPKHHFLVHYPTVIQNSGPVRYLSCFRFESMHRSLKLYTNNTTSRINIVWSIGVKLQFKNAYRTIQKKGFENTLNVSHLTKLYLKDEPYYKFLKPEMLPTSLTGEVYVSKEIEIKGTLYKRNFILITSNDCLKVYRLDLVFIDQNNGIFFLCYEYESIFFDEHLHGYTVGPELHIPIILNSKNIYSPPIHLHLTPNGKNVIRLKYF